MDTIVTRLLRNSQIKERLDNIAIILPATETEVTYEELYDLIHTQFNNYYNSPVPIRPGGVILNIASNTLDTILLLYAAIMNNMVVINATEQSAREILKHYPIDVVIGGGKDNRDVEVLLPTDTVKFPKNIPATILFTSGSTGVPKGVCHSHTGMMAAIDSINQYLEHDTTTRVITKLPLHHGYGLYQILSILDCGGSVVLEPENIMMSKLVNDIRRYNATEMPIVPSMAQMLFTDTSFVDTLVYLNTITSASSQMPPKYIDFINQHLIGTKYITMYGQTECVRALWLDPKYKNVAPHATGKPIPGVVAFLIDENNNLSNYGELIISGNNVMDGYFCDPELTEKVFVKQDDRVLLHTGDIFKVDENGLYYYIGRRDDIIKINDERISLNQLDNAAMSCLGVMAAVSCYVNDKFILHIVKDDNLSLNAIKKHYASVLGRNFVPQDIYVHTELPKNSSGKYDRKFLSNIS